MLPKNVKVLDLQEAPARRVRRIEFQRCADATVIEVRSDTWRLSISGVWIALPQDALSTAT
jgi:hypothetical protein